MLPVGGVPCPVVDAQVHIWDASPHNQAAPDGEVYALDLLREVCRHARAPVIASGGVSTLDDLRALATLESEGVEGVIAGKALYAGAFTVAEALAVLASAGGTS